MVLPSLVSTDWLNDNLDNPKLVVLDATLAKPKSAGELPHQDVMIPGAQFFDIDGAFSDSSFSLPHMMCNESQFEAEIQKLGVDEDSLIIVYDSHGVYSAPRAWWMMKSMGIDQVAVLNGGLLEWIDKGYRCLLYTSSPMAISVTRLYKKYTNYHRLESDSEFGHHIFDAPFVHYVTEQSKSKVLNTLKDRAIIISASGMATGGRILHHLYHRLPNEQDTVLFTGFLPEGTRGKDIVNGNTFVKIFGEEVKINAKVHMLEGLSAHADQDELMEWSSHIHDHPKQTFLIHGEKEQAMILKERLSGRGWNVVIPDYLEGYTLFDHL